jgi:phosphate starvation-inducible protein PhoH and related proteins
LKQNRSPEPEAGGAEQIELAFDNNRLVSALYGEYDQNLALIEQKLGLEAAPRGNHVLLRGPASAIDQGRRVLVTLYERLEQGHELVIGDVDGAIRMIIGKPAQPAPANPQEAGRIRMARIVTRKSTIVARSPAQDAYIRAMADTEMVFGTGPAGTGKTYLAVACAASLLERGEVARIILSRPAVEAGERLGFLPGDMKDKVDPYLRPLYDALHDMMPPEHIERCVAAGTIEVAPLAFMRGRTLANAAIILDEAQNTTSMQMKMFLTRLGEGSKMIVTGDPSQVDLPPGQKSGLLEVLDLLSGVKGIHFTKFSDRDVVRHELVARIVRAYDSKN